MGGGGVAKSLFCLRSFTSYCHFHFQRNFCHADAELWARPPPNFANSVLAVISLCARGRNLLEACDPPHRFCRPHQILRRNLILSDSVRTRFVLRFPWALQISFRLPRIVRTAALWKADGCQGAGLRAAGRSLPGIQVALGVRLASHYPIQVEF